jgi:hypothetical protein
MKLIYIAHPYGGNPENANAAEEWCAKLSKVFNAVFFAPWISLVRHWEDSGETRERGLMLDLEAVKRADEIWFITNTWKLSSGQKQEEECALKHNIKIRYFQAELLEQMIAHNETIIERINLQLLDN